MRKRVLSLVLTALLTGSQFSVVQAATDKSSIKAVQEQGAIGEAQQASVEKAELSQNNDVQQKDLEGNTTEEAVVEEQPNEGKLVGEETVVEETPVEQKATEEGATQDTTTVEDNEAKEIKLGDKVTVNFDASKPIQTYKVNLTKGGTLYSVIDGYSAPSTDFEIYDMYGNEILKEALWVYPDNKPQDFKFTQYMHSGSYIIKVTNKTGQSGNFSFTLNQTPADNNDVEPNNTIETAQAITLQSPKITGIIANNDEFDIYKLELAQDKLVSLDITSETYNFSFIAQVVDDKGNIIFDGRVHSKESKVLNLKQGTYYVKIIREMKNDSGLYTLKFNNISDRETGWIVLGNGDKVYYDAATKSLKTGWLDYNGTWYYLNDEGIMYTGLLEWKGSLYYLSDNNGAMATGWHQIGVGQSWYYFDEDGTARKGWLLYKNNWYYLSQDGTMRKGLQEINGSTYYLDSDGAMQTGWIKAYGSWFYFQENGVAKANGWMLWGNKWYYFQPDGGMATGVQNINGKFYYLDTDGVMQTGWKSIDNKWYYFAENGVGKASEWFYWGNSWYFFNVDGSMLTGYWEIYGEGYYLNDNGAMHIGWKLIEGQWHYFGSNGTEKIAEWAQIGSNWYFFNEYGEMLTGAWEIDGNLYYFDSEGVMQTGWERIEGYWYYFNGGGDLKTGWLSYGGHWYYLAPEMVTGFYMVDGSYYQFGTDGKLLEMPPKR